MPRRLASLAPMASGVSEGWLLSVSCAGLSLPFFRSRLALHHAGHVAMNFFVEGKIERSTLDKAIKDLGINVDKPNPVDS